VLAVLDTYRPRYAKVAVLASFGGEFGSTGELEVVEPLDGIGMTDYYGLSGRPASPEKDPMTEAECARKIALLRASWNTFDDVAARVSHEIRKGPGRRVGTESDHPARQRRGDRRVRAEGRREGPAGNEGRFRDPSRLPGSLRRGDPRTSRSRESARSRELQFLIRRCAWHMLDHAWELEDRDLTNAPA
jgi:hypothetical protein